MTFNLPAAKDLHNNNSVGRGVTGSPQSGQKTAGNLPITTNAQQLQNNTGSSLTGAPDFQHHGLLGGSSTVGIGVGTNTRVLLWSVQYNAPNRIQSSNLANGGARIRLGSGSGNPPANYREFYIGGNDTPFCSAQAGPVTICIDLNDDSHDFENGFYNVNDVETYGFGCVRFNQAGSSTLLCFFQRMFLFETTKDATDIPKFTGANANWQEAFDVVNGTDYTDKIGSWLTLSGSTYFVPIPWQIGDGSSATTFDDQGVSVVSPGSNQPGAENFRLTNQAMRVYCSLRNNAADTAVLSGAYFWGTAAPWDFSQSDAAQVTLSGTFNGMGEFTVGSSCTCSGIWNLASGSDVVIQGADMTGSTINGNVRLESATDLTNVTINGDLEINTGGNSTLTFNNVTVTGNVTNTGTGTLTINSLNGSSITTTEPGTGAGQVNIIQTVALTIQGWIASGTLVIYDLDDADPQNLGTELQRNNNVVSDEIYQYPSGKAGDDVIVTFYISGYKHFQRRITLSSNPATFTIDLELESN